MVGEIRRRLPRNAFLRTRVPAGCLTSGNPFGSVVDLNFILTNPSGDQEDKSVFRIIMTPVSMLIAISLMIPISSSDSTYTVQVRFSPAVY